MRLVIIYRIFFFTFSLKRKGPSLSLNSSVKEAAYEPQSLLIAPSGIVD